MSPYLFWTELNFVHIAIFLIVSFAIVFSLYSNFEFHSKCYRTSMPIMKLGFVFLFDLIL